MTTNRENWIAALRSGEYAQTREVLADDVGYCCLGVACEVWIKTHPNSDLLERDGHEYIVRDEGFEFTVDTDLPDQIRQEFGLSMRGMTGCINLNDTAGLSFAEIADVLEANAEEQNGDEQYREGE